MLHYSMLLALLVPQTPGTEAPARDDLRAAAVQELETGRRLHREQDFAEAAKACEAAVDRARELGEHELEMHALAELAQVLEPLGELQRAVDVHERTLELASELGDRAQEASSLAYLGSVRLEQGDAEGAREVAALALELAETLEDGQTRMVALRVLGTAWFDLDDYPRAREHYEAYLQAARERGDRKSEAAAIGRLAGVWFQLGETRRALEGYEAEAELLRELGDARGEASARGNAASAYWSLGDHAGAGERFEEVVDIMHALGDRNAECRFTGNLGVVRLYQRRFDEACELFESQIALARELGNRSSEATGRLNLAQTLTTQKKLREAEPLLLENLALVRELGNSGLEAATLGVLGLTYKGLGDLSRAREYTEGALAIARETGDRRGEARGVGNLGNVCYGLGDYVAAKRYHERHLELSRELGNKTEERNALNNLGLALLGLAEYDRARATYEEMLAATRASGDRRGEAGALSGIGSVHVWLGEHEEAREPFEQALAINREIEAPTGVAKALANLANVENALDRPEVGRELAREADAILRGLGTPVPRLDALLYLTTANLSLGDHELARASLATAEALIDELTATGLESTDASGLRGRFAGLGAAAQDLTALRCAAAGDDAAARDEAVREGFAAAGRWKGRALLEGITEHVGGARSAESIELRAERQRASAEHGVLLVGISEAIRSGASSAEVDALRKDADALRTRIDELAERLREIAPREAALDVPLGVAPGEVRAAVLTPDALLIEYVQGPLDTYAYVLDARGLDFVELGRNKELAELVGSYLEGIGDPTRLAGVTEIATLGSALEQRLLAPALAGRTDVKRLVIVPGAAFAALPFEALVVEAPDAPRRFDELAFVLDRYEVSYGPSTPVLFELAGMKPRGDSGRLLVLADPRYASERGALDVGAEAPASSGASMAFARKAPAPDSLTRLPGTRDEALAIARSILGEDPRLDALRAERSGDFTSERVALYLGAEAARERLAGDLRGYSVLHLACHGFVDAEEPERSGVALAASGDDDGFFTIADALQLDLDCDLVVLSACQTARGEVKAGEGVESIARAFLYAGSRGLVASLWQVDDRAAASTMASFYAAWHSDDRSPANALRAAKLALRKGELDLGPTRGVATDDTVPATDVTGHPYYWAPFVYVGLPR